MAAKIRISHTVAGDYSVQALDSNGVWVVADHESSGFATRQEAQECADNWLASGDYEQEADNDA